MSSFEKGNVQLHPPLASWEADCGGSMVEELLRYSQDHFAAIGVMLTWIGNDGNFAGIKDRNVDDGYKRDYDARAKVFDPLAPAKLLRKPKSIHCLSAILIDQSSDGDVRGYEKYLARYGYADELDLVLCDDSAPVAILSVLKDRRIDVSEHTRAFHRFTEHFIRAHPAVRQWGRQRRLGSEYGLTAREIEVVELVRQGASNNEVSERLGIGETTVKTHVARALEKLNVESRTALAAAVSKL